MKKYEFSFDIKKKKEKKKKVSKYLEKSNQAPLIKASSILASFTDALNMVMVMARHLE